MNILIKLQQIDRRFIYLVVILVLAIPLIVRPANHPKLVVPEVQSTYDLIEGIPTNKSLPKDNIVLFSSAWGPGTEAENGPQTAAIMRHMFKRGVKFAVVSWDLAGSEMTYKIGKDLEKELHKTYGTDWVHFGFKPLDKSVILGIAQDLPGIMDRDKTGQPVKNMPVMRGIKNYHNISAVVEATASGTLEQIIAYLTQPHGIPLIYCPTAVMSVEAYKYLDSGQVKGMLNSVIGAEQYEYLLGMTNVVTDASVTTWALSSAHIFIILLIVLGNLGYMASKRAERRQGGIE